MTMSRAHIHSDSFLALDAIFDTTLSTTDRHEPVSSDRPRPSLAPNTHPNFVWPASPSYWWKTSVEWFQIEPDVTPLGVQVVQNGHRGRIDQRWSRWLASAMPKASRSRSRRHEDEGRCMRMHAHSRAALGYTRRRIIGRFCSPNRSPTLLPFHKKR